MVNDLDFQALSKELVAAYISLLDNLDARLCIVLKDELSRGNKIANVNYGWPSKYGLLVQLAWKMNLDRNLPSGVFYKHINDRHYWIHEFTAQRTDNPESYDLIICNERELPRNA